MDSEDQYQASTLAIARQSTSDDSETREETVTRTEHLEQIRKAASLRKRYDLLGLSKDYQYFRGCVVTLYIHPIFVSLIIILFSLLYIYMFRYYYT